MKFLWCFLLCLVSPLVVGQEQVQWCRFDLPPIQILSGPEAGRGAVDGHIAFFKKALPEFEHKDVQANIRRVNELARAGEPMLCPGSVYSVERAAYMQYSLPYSVSRPPMLLVVKSRLADYKPFLNKQGELQLEKLLTRSEKAVGIASGRSYGTGLDSILTRLQPRKNIVVRPASSDIQQALVKMVMLDRIDATLFYPAEIKYILNQIGDAPDLATLAIENPVRYTTIHVIAPKTPWGDAMIARINEIIRRNRSNPELFKWTEYWYNDETLVWYRKTMKEMLQTPQEPH